MKTEKPASDSLRAIAANTARDLALALRLASLRMESFEPGQGKDAVRELAEQLSVSARRAVELYYQETLTQAVAKSEGPLRVRRTDESALSASVDSVNLQHFKSETAGCYNRFGFEVLLDCELERARRRKSPLSVALFKAQPPDPSVVAEVARHARDCCRLLDVLSVFDRGLGLLLPDTGQEGAQVAAIRVLSSYQSVRDSAGGPKAETLSVGVATYPDDGPGSSELLTHADARAEGEPLVESGALI